MFFISFCKRTCQKVGIGFVLILIVSFHIIIISSNTFFIKYAMNQIEDDARLINTTGKIRGGVQRVVKLEFAEKEYQNDIKIVDEIFQKILDKSNYKLDSSKMQNYLEKITLLNNSWEELKVALKVYSADKTKKNKDLVFLNSEEFWFLSEDLMKTLSIIATQKTYIFQLSFIIFAIEFFLIIFVIFIINKFIRKKLEILSRIDPLTNAYNRNVYNEYMENELESFLRYKNSVAFIILDIDFFKTINDTFGHKAGDMVLKDLVKIVSTNIRKTDKLFRIGGEEFVVLTKKLDQNDLEELTNKLKDIVQEYDFGLNKEITISLGATFFKDGDTKESIFKRADEALYRSKNDGRNRVTIF